MLRLSRRRFVTVGLGAALAAPSVARAAGAEPVVVVGAGLAWLAAAHRLVAAGQAVIVLEASERPGGRVRTERQAFPKLHAETGAARIAETHATAMRYIAQFGLALSPFLPPRGAPLIVEHGQSFTNAEAAVRLDGELSEKERGLSPSALLDLYAGDTVRGMTEEEPEPVAYARWAQHDGFTWPQWLRTRGASAAAVARITLGGDSTALSALYVLRQVALHRNARTYFKLRDGMDGLAQAFARELGARVRYRAPVVRIERSDNGARVMYTEGGRVRILAASHIVLAVPLTTLRSIEIAPALSPERTGMIGRIGYYPAARFLLQGQRRFWTAYDLNGAARTDHPAEIWDATYDQRGDAPVLAVTVGGALGWRVASMSERDALRLAVEIANTALPGFQRSYRTGMVQRWPLDPWARGAFVTFGPGEMVPFMSTVSRRAGVLHFAGEHTSSYMSWIEGALRSGERAAAEIVEG